ncbi:putative ABC transporter solute-binding protein YclQ precursor [Streptococcus intermedius]|uniref:siderophore ABC transporter substrate-binding protein n=1 Tax=Streptococcus intermedius TaxID=1338 RepID=UPI000F68ABBE|nr:siderophore ABC transporter substrate-binding protein [Streptococcus intermedius]RSJ09526.1 putative ABC transporter solute-binding protein YclQ precursor [Streptococcus intermedius]RSJ15496.1 putative ABC transporter solute-binding protein YclQ precursor [Streptococcus intermedius]RSJ29814.1 putative ABC transporter solute-binding protein YclQ precursor [Streptococcus intermedius]
MKQNTKKLLLSILTAFAVVLLAACGAHNKQNTKTNTSSSASEVSIKSAAGETKVPINPKKIVTFDLGAADTIRALGKESSLAGIPKKTLPAYLKNLSKNIKNVGTMKEPDMEAIAALKPDLIIASPRTAQYVKKLKEIAPTVLFKADNKDYWGSTKQNILSLASIFGEDGTKKAKSELAALDKEIESVASANEKSTKKALTLMLNEGAMSAFGAKSRFAFLYRTLKFKATDAKIKDSRHGQEVSFESVKQINPDIIFSLNRTLAIGGDNSVNKDLLNNSLIQETNAAKKKAIVNLTSDLWYLSGGGLESTKLMIKDVKNIAGK